MRRFVEAWEAVDVRGLISLLCDDAVMTMPDGPCAPYGVMVFALDRESIVGITGFGEYAAVRCPRPPAALH